MATEKRLIDANKFKHKMKLEFLDRRNKFISMKDLFECVDDMETVDAVVVVHGRWEAEYEYEDFQYATCSVCGKRSEYMTKFCGNCGAKMDGDGNG